MQGTIFFVLMSSSSVPKQPPSFCLKWPWQNQLPSPPPPKSACDLDSPPWMFKSLQTLGAITFDFFGSVLNTSQLAVKFSGPFQLDLSKLGIRKGSPASITSRKKSRSPEEQAEAEQRAFASALASGKAATVLEFYSPKCSLCSSLVKFVSEMEKRNSDWLHIAMADAENDQWLPELLHYDIKYVPCFVILDEHGRALAKTGVPSSRLHVVAGLSHLLKLKRPSRD